MIIDFVPFADPALDESWLRCRVLAFLHTDYFDDVHPEIDRFDNPALRLVEAVGQEVRGILDVELFPDGTTTIDCVAVHPDHQGRGVGTGLLAAAVARLPADRRTLDAWTREDPGTLAWYAARGFVERERYLHVYVHADEDRSGWRLPAPLRGPVTAFTHVLDVDREDELRERFRRVYVCRQLVKTLAGGDGTAHVGPVC